MKKLIAMILIMALCLMSLSALAETNGDDMVFKNLGITLHFPDLFREIQGTIELTEADEVTDDEGNGLGVYNIMLVYVGMPQEQLDAMIAKEEHSDEEIEQMERITAPLLFLVGVKDGVNMEAVMGELMAYPDAMEEITQAGGVTWYNISMVYSADIEDDDYSLEYAELAARIPEVLSMSEYYAPIDPKAEMQNKHIEFTTTDLYGNLIDSAELFSQHEYTAVNIWTSWCDFCIKEMPEMNALNDRLENIDCAIVGLLHDSAKPGKLEKGIRIVEENGVGYTVIQAPENVTDLFYVQGFPETYIVDRNGNVVGDPFVGVAVDKIEARMRELTGN